MPEPPYREGDRVAVLSLEGVNLRVVEDHVRNVEGVPGQDEWVVTTRGGTEVTVDIEGEGGILVPVDPEIAAEFFVRGKSFLVEPAIGPRQDKKLDQGIERGEGRSRGRGV